MAIAPIAPLSHKFPEINKISIRTDILQQSEPPRRAEDAFLSYVNPKDALEIKESATRKWKNPYSDFKIRD
jgi:hypothetical protein